ncbi:MAG TPA: Hpt domain-containing protein [Phycisphaerales bacterium]|nr:Hpt domain-containing protein [Phycisphaerales bacterium]
MGTDPPGPDPRPAGALHSQFASDPEMAEVVRLFVGDMPSKLAQLRSLWDRHDIDTLRRLSHQLKGAAAGFGYPSLSQAAGRLECELIALSEGSSPVCAQHLRGQFEELIRLCTAVAPS